VSNFTSSTNIRFEKHIVIEEESLLAVDILADATDLSKQCMKHAMKKGAVWVTPANAVKTTENNETVEQEQDGGESDNNSEPQTGNKKTQRLRRAKKVLQPGDTLHLYYDENILAEQPPEPRLIADEGQYSIWYKPYGLRSQGSKWSDHCTIYRWVEMNLEPQRPAFSVHRLDRAATGLMIIAHKKSTAVEFSRMFAKRDIEKRYRVIVQGKFPETPEPFTMNNEIDGRSAISHATLLEYSENQDCSLLEISIESGRKHQIRRHLSEAGFPVVGDRLYGKLAKDSVASEGNSEGNPQDNAEGQELLTEEQERLTEEQPDLQLTACYLSFRYLTSGGSESPWGKRVENEKTYQLDDEYNVHLPSDGDS